MMSVDLQDAYIQYAFPPFQVIRKVLNKLRSSKGAKLILIASFWPQMEWFPDLVELTINTPRRLPLRKDLLHQPHFQRHHLNPHVLHLVGWRLSSDSGYSRAVAQTVVKARRHSTIVNNQRKWKNYRQWCRKHGHAISRPSSQKFADFLLHLCQTRGLSVSAVKSYKSMLNSVFSL